MSKDVGDQKIVLVELAQAIASVFVAVQLGRFADRQLFLSVGLLIPADFSDALIRFPSCALAVAIAWQLWGRNFLMPLIVTGAYLYSDFRHMADTPTIDWSPFLSLGRQTGLNVWAVLLIIATLLGALCGQWLGARLWKRLLRIYRYLSSTRSFLGDRGE